MMPEQIDLGYALGLAPEKAVEYFESKGYTFSWNWQDTWQEAHSIAFTVAKCGRLDVLQDIRDELQRALEDGETLEDFRRSLEPRLKAKGWWGQTTVGDGQGGAEIVQLGSPWRLETIYRANMQSAYNAGRWAQQMDNAAARPFLQYVALESACPICSKLNGLVFRNTDAFWDTHYPPNHWGCQCSVRALDQRNLDERGLSVISSDGMLSESEVVISQKTGELGQVTTFRFTDPRTGQEIVSTPAPGWNYNPGKAAWQPDLNKYDQALREAFQRYVRAKGG
jgi:SPP1 gp7 family putative phage head morphogenesis protein